MSDIVITVVSGETIDIGLSTPGMQGPAGVTPTFAIGNVNTVSASGATVTISGGPAYLLNFSLPLRSVIVNNQSGVTYTTTSGDHGKTIVLSNASGATFIVPSGLPGDFSCSVVQTGSGLVTLSGASGVGVFSNASLSLSGQYSVVEIFAYASNQYIATGSLAP